MRTKSQLDRARTPCALCGQRLSTPDGEHVLPQALLRSLFPPESGPFTTTWGTPDTPSRTVVARTFQRAKLPCCLACNDLLNRRFENPGGSAGRRLLSEDNPILSEAELGNAALWLLKTWLLLVHPETTSNEGLPQPAAWTKAPPQLWAWLVDGSPVPDGLTLWVQDGINPGGEGGEESRLLLPEITADGRIVAFLGFSLGFAKRFVSLIYHPDWPIWHPGVTAGAVLQLWPPIDGQTLNGFPKEPAHVIRFVYGSRIEFVDGVYGHQVLPPLTPDVPPYEPVSPWVRAAAL